MDNLNQDKIENNKSSSEEQTRIRRNFLEGLESLGREKEEILKKFDLRSKKVPFTDTDDQGKELSLDKNLAVFLEELDNAEAEIHKQRGVHNQAALNQGSSRLRILREKARTLLVEAKAGSQKTDLQETGTI